MAKIINIDASIQNADWAKRRKLDAENITDVESLLKFLNIDKSPINLSKSEIRGIVNNVWYSSLPKPLRRELSDIYDKISNEKV